FQLPQLKLPLPVPFPLPTFPLPLPLPLPSAATAGPTSAAARAKTSPTTHATRPTDEMTLDMMYPLLPSPAEARIRAIDTRGFPKNVALCPDADCRVRGRIPPRH